MGNTEGDIFDRISRGVADCQLGLRLLIRGSGTSPWERIKELREKITSIEAGPISQASKEDLCQLRSELEHLYMDEEIYWRQRCKNLWAKERDRNTRYFHAKSSKRRKNNTISGLQNSLGEWKEEVGEVENIISDYFSTLFTSSSPPATIIDEVLEAVSPVVSPTMNQSLSMSFTTSEVTLALSQMSPLKSPGPDGFPPIFFQKYWHILGSDISSCVLNFLNSQNLPRMLNFTFIVLIPKISNPKKITEFRPISLCNVIYKIGSKMIANRIKPFLNDIISPIQSAFVPKRLITDNVLVAFELNHFLKCRTRGKKQFMALKLDVSKAYDRIEWVFLRCVLLKMGFAQSLCL